MAKSKPSLLVPEAMRALREANFPLLLVEFFGKVSGMSKALNNSKNPAAAAHTMMKDPHVVKPGNKMSFAQMFHAFMYAKETRKKEKPKPIPAEIEHILDEYWKVSSDLTAADVGEEEDPEEKVTFGRAEDSDE
jgi:hypothetical protein